MSSGCTTTAQREALIEHRAVEAAITKTIIEQQAAKPKVSAPAVCNHKFRRVEIKPGSEAWLDQVDWEQSADEQDSRTAYCFGLLKKALN